MTLRHPVSQMEIFRSQLATICDTSNDQMAVQWRMFTQPFDLSAHLRDGQSRKSFSAKEPLIIGLFYVKWPIQIRHPMTLLHRVYKMTYKDKACYDSTPPCVWNDKIAVSWRMSAQPFDLSAHLFDGNSQKEILKRKFSKVSSLRYVIYKMTEGLCNDECLHSRLICRRICATGGLSRASGKR